MKKLVVWAIIVLISSMTWIWYAWNDVNVYAIVWNINKTPRITYVDPDFNPVLFGVWEVWSFVFSVIDEENEKIYYTITTDDGAVNPISWSLNWSGTVNFLYVAPWAAPAGWFTKIYITLNDWANFSVKEINLYIY